MRNRNVYIALVGMLLSIGGVATAQLPNYAECVGKGVIAGSSSFTVYTSDKTMDIYTDLEYGITDYFSVGAHYGSYCGFDYGGPDLRGGYQFNQWFGFVMHAMPSFDMTDHFRFTAATMGLYMGGAILPKQKLFWLTNSYATILRDGSTSFLQYWHLGSDIPLKGEHVLTPLLGCSHWWDFEEYPEISLGLVYQYKSWWFTVCCDNLISRKPAVSVCLEFEI